MNFGHLRRILTTMPYSQTLAFSEFDSNPFQSIYRSQEPEDLESESIQPPRTRKSCIVSSFPQGLRPVVSPGTSKSLRGIAKILSFLETGLCPHRLRIIRKNLRIFVLLSPRIRNVCNYLPTFRGCIYNNAGLKVTLDEVHQSAKIYLQSKKCLRTL